MHPFVRIFMFIWFGGVVMVGGALSFATVHSAPSASSSRRGDVLSVAVPLGMLGFGFALVRFGRYLARNEDKFLTDFLIHTLDGILDGRER